MKNTGRQNVIKLTIAKNEVGAWLVKETTVNYWRWIGSFATKAEAMAFKRGVEFVRAEAAGA